MSKAPLLVCYRIADNPIPNAESFKAACSKCGEAIWVAYSSPPAPRICLHCADLPGSTFLPPTPAQVADMAMVLKRPKS